jgi:nitrate reductase NapD
MNISSVIVIPQPERSDEVVQALTRIDGVEVAAVSPEGKIIATIEVDGDRETVETYETIAALDRVLSVAMVFHQKEDEPDAELAMAA